MVVAIFILFLIVSAFAEDPCEAARKQFLSSIPNQKTTTCHVMGIDPHRRDLIGLFIEMVDESRIILVYEDENDDDPTSYAEDDFIIRPRCIEDDDKFVQRYMTSEEIVDMLLHIGGCDDFVVVQNFE